MNKLWFDRVDLVCFDGEVKRDHHREQHRGQAGVGHGVDIDWLDIYTAVTGWTEYKDRVHDAGYDHHTQGKHLGEGLKKRGG